jgi:large subunit ribosomal protein L17
MRHRKKINHLSRKSAHRKAMLANMAASLILHKRINTTLAKAKVLRTYIEPLITKSKEDTTHSRRIVFSYLQNKEAVAELFRDISVKVAERPGGYTRIIKTGARLGDSAEMCMMELVDFNENLMASKEAAKEKPAARRRRGAKKSAALPADATPKQPAGKSTEKEVAEDQTIETVDVTDQEIVADADQQPETPEAMTEPDAIAETPSDGVDMKLSTIEETEISPADEPAGESDKTPSDETKEKDGPN